MIIVPRPPHSNTNRRLIWPAKLLQRLMECNSGQAVRIVPADLKQWGLRYGFEERGDRVFFSFSAWEEIYPRLRPLTRKVGMLLGHSWGPGKQWLDIWLEPAATPPRCGNTEEAGQ